MLNWRIHGRSLEVQDPESGQWARFCDAFGISRVEVNLLTRVHEIVLFVNSIRAGMNETKVLREDLQKRSVMSRLYRLGLALLYGDDDIQVVQTILLESEQSAPLVYHHDRLGFSTCNGKGVFLLDTPIGSIDPIKAGSHYVIPEVITPKGTIAGWLRVAETEVIGKPAMELALAIGALAPIAHLLRAAGVITDLPVVAYIGKSTSGKTTALRTGASIWGFPMESIGIIDDLNATENAFFESLARNTGFPAFIDETSAQTGWDFNSMVYFLPKGRSKKRCAPSGELKRTAMFSGAVVFTGEHSLIERAGQSSGLRARIVEIKLDKWTKDGAHAERITEGFCQNYGTAAPLLVEWLLVHQSELPAIYQSARSNLTDRAKGMNDVETRALKIYALILVAAHAVREALGLALNMVKVQELLVEQVMENRPEQDEITRVYHGLLEGVAANGSKFAWPTKKGNEHPRGKDIWGMFEFKSSTPCIWIALEKFRLILKGCGDYDLKDIARPLVERSWLVDFGGRHYYRTHKINGVPVDAACILLPETPSLLERLEELPGNASSRELTMALRGDAFEATVLSNQAETDRMLREAAEKEVSLMTCGFAFPCAQGEAFLINKELTSKLMLSDSVFVTVLSDENIFLLSRDPKTTSSLKLHLTAWKAGKICKNVPQVHTLMQVIGISLEIGQAVALTDVDVQSDKSAPIAVVCANIEDSIGIVVDTVTGWTLPTDANNEAYVAKDDK